MRICIYENAIDLGKHSAMMVSMHIRRALQEKGECSIILATGTSQLAMLASQV